MVETSSIIYTAAHNAVEVGEVDIRRVSPYLKNLSSSAKAKLYVVPKPTGSFNNAAADLSKACPLNKHITNILQIKENWGLHLNGFPLTGAKIHDRPPENPDEPYEEALAKMIYNAWKEANESGEKQITKITPPSSELLHGFSNDNNQSKIIVNNNICSQLNEINNKLKQQGSPEISQSLDADSGFFQITISECSNRQTCTKRVFPSNKSYDYANKQFDLASFTPIVLEVLPSTPQLNI